MTTALLAFAAALAIALCAWVVSLAKRDASIVDSAWAPMILVSGLMQGNNPWLLALAAVWALRLTAYITRRNWGQPEDRRYQAIRARNEPGFAWKSLYLVFGLQALLAWIVSAPLAAPAAPLDSLGAACFSIGLVVAAFGIAFEAVADWQVARFRARRPAPGEVLDSGLWRYSRHPNYFGEFCVWWGFGVAALATGHWWALVSPLLMTVLLLRVSGVALLEQDLHSRKPAYAAYSARTSAFFPWPPRA